MKSGLRGIAILVIALLGMGEATAQTRPSVPPKTVVPPLVASPNIQQIQARREYLFHAMLAKPDDLDAAFEYAALSSRVGDLEAAISTLERMLIFAPGLPRLQLELGVLYYRMSAFETARNYFQSAIAGPNVPPEVRTRVDQYLANIDKAADPVRFTGQVRAGIRYQSNANRSPTGSTIIIGGLPFSLDADSRGSPDGNVYGTGVFHLSYDLPSQGDSLELDLITYASKQFHRDELDIGMAEVTFGPAFDMGRFGIERAALGVYGIASGVYLDDDFYSTGIGAGTRFVIRPTPTTSLLAAVEYRHKDYYDSDSSPTASYRDGDELRAYTNMSYIISPTVVLAGTGYIQRAWADRGYLSYTEGGFSAGPRVSFKPPVGENMLDWTAALSAGAVFREYDDADPIIDPTEAESDWEAFIGGGITVPLKKDVALITELEYRYVDSNYDTRKFDNFSVSLSVAKSF